MPETDKESKKGAEKKENGKENKESKEDKRDPLVRTTWFLIAIIIVLITILSLNSFGITGNAINVGQDGKIKIGFMAPLTGDAASYGQSIQRGFDLALKEANMENIEVVYEDSKCDGKESVNAINKLINVNEVVAIV